MFVEYPLAITDLLPDLSERTILNPTISGTKLPLISTGCSILEN